MRITRHIFEWVALVAGLLVFASCREVAEPVAPAGDEVEFTIVAGAPGTRTTNQGLSTLWAEGDALSVIHSAAGSDEYYASRFDYVGGSANNVFRGRVRHLSASNDWYLIYPYSSANVSPEAVRITVPAGQTQVGNSSTAHLAGESFPLVVSARAVAESEQLEVTMNNVLTVFRYDLTNKTDAPIVVKSVELTAPVALVGDFEGDITGDTFTWAATQATGETAVLTVSDGASIAAGASASFYVGAAPFTIPAGGKLEVKATAVHPSAPETLIPFYRTISFPVTTSFGSNAIQPVIVSYDESHQEPQDPRRTYRYVGGASEGTFLILGYEPSNKTHPGAYLCTFPSNGDPCGQVLWSDDPDVTMVVTEDEDIIGNEVELTPSGSGWLIRSKANGQYLYYNNGIAFTTTASSAVHTVNSGSNGIEFRNNNYSFYHSDSGSKFQYRSESNACNLRLFKLGENVPDYPDGTYSIENEQVALYLNHVGNHPYDPSNRWYSYIQDYYIATSQSNRLDWPKGVPVSWTNPSSGNTAKTIEVYNTKAGTSYSNLEMTLTATASEVMAEIYNLIPGRTYYYRVLNGSTTVKEGQFETVGHRRMLKIGSDFGPNYANNCRDLGGQETLDGKVIRFGKIFRGSNMDQTSAAAQDILLNYLKIGLDVDLRTPGYSMGNNQRDALGLGNITANDASDYTGHTVESYNDSTDLESSKMGVTLTRIMNAVVNDVNVYVHCRIGADRTGFTCMMLEALLGVPLERCDIDYEMTSFSAAVGYRSRADNKERYYFSGVEKMQEQSGDTYPDKVYNYAVDVLHIDPTLISSFRTKMLENK